MEEDTAKALKTTSKSLKLAEKTGDIWQTPEIQRVAAKAILIEEGNQKAVSAFETALTLTRKVDAITYELRIATDLA